MAKWKAKNTETIELARKEQYRQGKQEYKTQLGFAESFIPGESEYRHDLYKRFIGTKDKTKPSAGVDKHIAEAICQALNLKLKEVAKELSSNQKSHQESLPENFVDLCRTKFLESQKLSSNPFTKINRNLDDIFVPLGLIEQKQHHNKTSSECNKIDEDEITRKFSYNQEFYQTVFFDKHTPISKGKRIAIIGEPGSGKTTQLQKIGTWLYNNSDKNSIVIWISLAELDKKNLEEYILNDWLRQILNLREVTSDIQQAFIDIFKNGKITFLLDAVDEMAECNPLHKIDSYLKGWISEATIVVTCRHNLWQNYKNELYYFDVFQNLDLNEENQNLLIEKYFDNSFTAIKMIESLYDYPNRGMYESSESICLKIYESIQDKSLADQLVAQINDNKYLEIKELIKRPLFLELLCESWSEKKIPIPEQNKEIYPWFLKNFINKFDSLGDFEKPKKKSIVNLIKNPLLLTLVCNLWEKRKNTLPETQTELYQWYMEVVYQWKDWNYQPYGNKYEAKKALNKALAELSKESIDREIPSFRLAHSLIKEYLGENDAPLYKMALDLGLLSKVSIADDNSDEPIYSFFHPTFQEYFAALAIDDWDYFLPRMHDNDNPKPIEGRRYRFLESKWYGVIKYWVGINSRVDEEDTEVFLRKIEAFRFGIWDKNVETDFFCPVRTQWISQAHPYYYNKSKYNVLEVCTEEYHNSYLSEDTYFDTYYIEETGEAIEIPIFDYISCLGSCTRDGLRGTNFKNILFDKEFSQYKECFREEISLLLEDLNLIGYNNLSLNMEEASIPKIFEVLEEKLLGFYLKKYNLKDNESFDLIKILIEKSKEYEILKNRFAAYFVAKSSTKINLCLVVSYIKKNIYHLVENQKNNISRLYGYGDPLMGIIQHCAENMSYPDFYDAWHSSDAKVESLEKQFSNFSSILNDLQPTDHTYPINIDLKYLENTTDAIEIAQEICNQIYQIALPKISKIPEVNNAAQLKRLIPEIKRELKTDNLVLLLSNCEPYEELVIFCRKLSSALTIFWITDKTLEYPLKGIPIQDDLISKIQSRINESI